MTPGIREAHHERHRDSRRGFASVVGNSWGSLLGVLAIAERPDLYAACFGIGQMVDPRQTGIMFWEDVFAWAERRSGLGRDAHRQRPPPYDDLLAHEAAVGSEDSWNAYPEFDPGNEMPAILMVPGYDLIEKINGFRGFLETFSVLDPNSRTSISDPRSIRSPYRPPR